MLKDERCISSAISNLAKLVYVSKFIGLYVLSGIKKFKIAFDAGDGADGRVKNGNFSMNISQV
jgi:hypothetical protein